MNALTFNETLCGLSRRTPLQPFTVDLQSKFGVVVNHLVEVTFGAGFAVLINSAGKVASFAHKSLSRLADLNAAALQAS